MNKKQLLILFIPLLLSFQTQASGTINFTTIMPDAFEFCGKEIGRADPEYKALWNWFNNNTTGWYESTRQYELETVYMAKTMRVNMTDNKVIVSYAASGVGAQHVRAAKTAAFSKLCNS